MNTVSLTLLANDDNEHNNNWLVPTVEIDEILDGCEEAANLDMKWCSAVGTAFSTRQLWIYKLFLKHKRNITHLHKDS